jgi:hypothetical protein
MGEREGRISDVCLAHPTGNPLLQLVLAYFSGFKESIAYVAGFDHPAINLPIGSNLAIRVKTSAG